MCFFSAGVVFLWRSPGTTLTNERIENHHSNGDRTELLYNNVDGTSQSLFSTENVGKKTGRLTSHPTGRGCRRFQEFSQLLLTGGTQHLTHPKHAFEGIHARNLTITYHARAVTTKKKRRFATTEVYLFLAKIFSE